MGGSASVGPELAKAATARDAPRSGPAVRAMPEHATVLVAEDDPETRRALCDLLASDGYVVIEAADGGEALEHLAGAADGGLPLPDVVLLDFVMPRFSGLGILRVMRRFARRPQTIVMTGFPDPSVEAFARNLGALRVLRKPIDEDVLADALAEALRLAREPAAARGA